jgi:hypothetical protein
MPKAIRKIMIELLKYGPCDLYCGACGATDCGGCQSEGIDDWVRNCKFRLCSHQKNIDFWCYCSNYPGKELKAFTNDQWPHHWTIASNLEFIKQNGTDEWLRAQEQEWACQNCQSEIKWYQKICKCGHALNAWIVPEQ